MCPASFSWWAKMHLLLVCWKCWHSFSYPHPFTTGVYWHCRPSLDLGKERQRQRQGMWIRSNGELWRTFCQSHIPGESQLQFCLLWSGQSTFYLKNLPSAAAVAILEYWKLGIIFLIELWIDVSVEGEFNSKLWKRRKYRVKT